jgi:hypothetical protein
MRIAKNNMKNKIVILCGCFLAGSLVVLASAQTQDGNFIQAAQSFANLGNDEKEMVLSSLGLSGTSNFSWPKMLGGMLFGSVGFIAFVYGKKQQYYRTLGVGIVLMVYPYFVSNALWLYILGVVLCSVLYFWRD